MYPMQKKIKGKKKEFKVECECHKKIIGFSEHHANENLKLHKKISKDHRERMKLISEVTK